MRLKYIVISSCFIYLIACSFSKQKEPDLNNSTIHKNLILMETPNPDTLFIISLEDAITMYGEPKTKEQFNTKDVFLSEFRIELYNYYSKDEIEKGIILEELTWEKDSVSNITVWYETKGDKKMPKNLLIWNKDAEF
jgi:hypothetical protein